MTAFGRALEEVFVDRPPTPREREVMELWIVDGLTMNEIAEKLVISPRTVDHLLYTAVDRSTCAESPRKRRALERALLMSYAVHVHREGAICGE